MDFDYMIVGAGSAGCVLADRLSADPSIRVCLLEAGPRDKYPFIHMPGAFGLFMFSRKYNWGYHAPSDPSLRRGSPLFCPRGKALGGSSSTNGMIYIRGHSRDFDHWAALGNEGRSHDEVLPYFRRSGIGPYQFTIKDGRRSSTATAKSACMPVHEALA